MLSVINVCFVQNTMRIFFYTCNVEKTHLGKMINLQYGNIRCGFSCKQLQNSIVIIVILYDHTYRHLKVYLHLSAKAQMETEHKTRFKKSYFPYEDILHFLFLVFSFFFLWVMFSALPMMIYYFTFPHKVGHWCLFTELPDFFWLNNEIKLIKIKESLADAD